MSVEELLPPEEHFVVINEAEDDNGHVFYELTCPCGLDQNVEATPSTTSTRPTHWAENVKKRHYHQYVGFDKNDKPIYNS